MSNNTIISLETARQLRHLKEKFPSDFELVATYYLAQKLHAEDLGEQEGQWLCVNRDAMQRWVQKRLADSIEARGIHRASVYKVIPYVARLLVTFPGLTWTEWKPTQRYHQYQDANDHTKLLRLAEECFFVFCFFPEDRTCKSLRYRRYAFIQGTQAYRVFGWSRKNPLGSDMDEAFVPIGDTVRREFSGTCS